MKLRKRINAWYRWQKYNLDNRWYQLGVLFMLVDSPTFEQFLDDETLNAKDSTGEVWS